MTKKTGYKPPYPTEGESIRINVLIDQKTYNIAKKYGHNNISAGLRYICKEYDRLVTGADKSW